MKIGDKVRFLSESGGGVVSGFQGKDMVLVEDEDGFEIPMLRSQVVVIDTDDYNLPTPESKKKQEAPAEEKELEPCDKPITFKAKPVERKGGNLLNVYLGFVESENEEGVFDAYLINDSNYYLQVLYMTAENASWHCRYMLTLEPNTKHKVDEFNRLELGERERICIQTLAYKTDKPFLLKPALSVELRLDTVKFYKVHTFQSSPFFRMPAYVMDVIRDDKAAK